jgi:hypothetical protein
VKLTDLNNALIDSLKAARTETRYVEIMVEHIEDVLSPVAVERFDAALRAIDEALEWALADLEIPECVEARDAAA